MLVFVVLGGLIAFLLHRQIETAYLANPGLNTLILAVLVIGVILTLRQVLRLYPEIAWVNNFRLADPGLAMERPPKLLAPMAAILGSRIGRMAISAQMMRGILDSIATRLDEARDISRYMTGLLVFLGLLGTFWGLIETVSSVGNVIQNLKAAGDAGSMFDSLREGLAAPLGGMGISFSSSLFGLAGSLVLGFLDLQSSQAQNRFYTELEDWLSTTVYDQAPEVMGATGGAGEVRSAMERLREAVEEAGGSKAAPAAMANLAEAIQGLVHHMRTEQQMIRDWVDCQAEQQREIKPPWRSGAREREPARGYREDSMSPMALARARGEHRHELLAGLRRRAVDAGPRHHLPAVGVRGGAVLSAAGSAGQGHRAAAAQRADRPAHRPVVDGEDRQGRPAEPLAQLRATLATAENERDKFKGIAAGEGKGTAEAQGKIGALAGQLQNQKKISAQALAQVEVLNQQIAAMRRQLAAIETALNASEQKNKQQQGRITDLGQRLNIALAHKVQELTKYRSDFFGELRKILGNRPDMHIVGDRFVLQSEVFFDTGSADLKPEGQAELDKVASALLTLEQEIPSKIAWVLRVDGHTDKRPIAPGGRFQSNWELSAARAISVVKYLIAKGVKPERLVAAGFGEYDPIDPADTAEAYSKNRRIEFKLTER